MSSTIAPISSKGAGPALHFAKRGQVLEDDAFAEVSGFNAERMRARALLTAEEEKKLLRRIDWHIMPLCALMVCTEDRGIHIDY